MRMIPRSARRSLLVRWALLTVIAGMLLLPGLPADASENSALLRDVQENFKPYKPLVEAAQRYFDLEDELWRTRKGFIAELSKLAEAKKYALKDPEFLRWLVYQGRSFRPDMRDRKWVREQGDMQTKNVGPVFNIKSERLTLAFMLPKSYPKKIKDWYRKLPREVGPYPTLMLFHEKGDYTGQDWPGAKALKRLYPKGKYAELYESWVVFMPVAAAGNFTDKDNQIRHQVVRRPLSVFWKHYNIDFDRIVVDGSQSALAVLASLPMIVAGAVVRGGTVEKELVQNYAHVPIYVVGKAKLGKELMDAGHGKVTVGGEDGIIEWIQQQRRTTPKKFSWFAQSDAHSLAQWVNLDSVNWSSPERSLEVEVVDTKDEPNTIKLSAKGVRQVSFYLNDEIVDLDRPVRVVINGHLQVNRKLEPEAANVAALGRDFDQLFNWAPIKIRESMFFGWLMPARIVREEVRAPKKDEKKDEPKKPVKKATPEEEVRAERLMAKAKQYLANGDEDSCKKYLDKVLAYPENAQTAEAREMREKLGD